MARLYERNPHITEREVGDEVFLVNPDSDETYYLNVTGAALWRLLAEPTSLQDAVAILHDAFPDGDRAGIEANVAALFTDFVEHGLVTKSD